LAAIGVEILLGAWEYNGEPFGSIR
jgi:hypothetical protein